MGMRSALEESAVQGGKLESGARCSLIPDLVLGLLIQRTAKDFADLGSWTFGDIPRDVRGDFKSKRERGEREGKEKEKESACASSTLTMIICFIMQQERLVQ
jgi:hypothetical protein